MKRKLDKLYQGLNNFSPILVVGLILGIIIKTLSSGEFFIIILYFVLIILISSYYLVQVLQVKYFKLIFGLMVFMTGIVAASLLKTSIPNSSYETLYNKQVEMLVEVISDPEDRDSHQRFLAMPTVDKSRPLHKILVRTDPFIEVEYGDLVIIRGELNPVENFITDSGREFLYQEYLSVRGVGAIMSFAEISHQRTYKKSLRRLLAELKSHYLKVLRYYLPEPEASLAGGITVGSNDALGQDNEELFRRVGLTHIIVLSGYNVAIVVMALSGVLAFLPYWLSVGVAVGGIWLFVLLVGGSTTIIRAGIMASIAVVARLFGSPLSGLTLLAWAIALMVINNPLIVMYDPSFQLSVLATIGIILVTPIIERYFNFVTVKLGLREIITTTLATQLTVIPWIVYIIGDFSIVSPLANLAVLPIVPLAMLGSVMLYALYFLSMIPIISALPVVMSFIVYGMLSYVFLLSHTLGGMQWSSLSLPPFSVIWVVMLYLLISLILFKIYIKNKTPRDSND